MSANPAPSDRSAPIDLARESDFVLGSARARPSLSEVVAESQTIRLQPRVMQVLVALVRAEGEVVSRDDLVSQCWGGLSIGDDAINRCIGRLRRLAVDEIPGAFAIETLNKIGYRLTSAERPLEPPAEPESAPRATPRPARRAFDGAERPALAVLAFDHASDGGQEIGLAKGLAEDIVTGLARSKLLTVISRQSSHSFDARGLLTDRICAELGVDYIVQGQVRMMGAAARISAHLVSGRDDKTVWSARYDRSTGDLFALQDEVSAAIVASLEPALLAHEEARALRMPADERSYWDLFVTGRWHFWRSTLPDIRTAHELLVRALRLKPDDAPALSLLAHCWLMEVWAGVARDPRQSISQAHRCALQAVHLDGSDAFAHFTMGVVLSTMGRPDQDMAEQRRALELNPNLPAAHGEMGRLLAFEGKVDEALACCDRAIGASPNDPHLWLWLLSKAIACFTAARYDEAAQHAADACAIRPDYFFLHFMQAACAAAAGRSARALIAMDEGRRLMPRYTMAALKMGHPFANPEHLMRYVDALETAGWVDASKTQDASPD